MMSSPISSLSTGLLGDGDHLRRILRQHDVAALVVFVNDRIYVFARNRGRRVHVRDEADAPAPWNCPARLPGTVA